MAIDKKVKRIAVLTSGGDAPGMNAAVRAVVRSALFHGLEVYGIEEGYLGLREGRIFPMSAGTVGDILQSGGTFLGSARLPQLATDADTRQQCYDNLKAHQIDGLVVCGGDGSYKGAALIEKESGVPVVGVPATIDNDLAYTDFTIGFDTAVNTCVDSINALRDTMSSHGRVAIIEVMGRSCGDIAVYAGIAGGAEAILVPEIKRSDKQWLDYIVTKLRHSRERKKKYGIIVMAEGLHLVRGDMSHFTPNYIANWLNINGRSLGLEVDARGIVLGHVQRGGSPTASDRILAARLGEAAVDILRNGGHNRCVGIVRNRIVDVDIDDALNKARHINKKLIELADILAL